MSNDNQNEFKGWGNKLSQLESVSGDPVFQKEEAWAKLQDRVNKNEGKSTAWYWMAAAILLLAAGLWLLDGAPTNKENIPVTKHDQTPVTSSQHSGNVLPNRVLMQEKDDKASLPAAPVKKFKRKILSTPHTVQLEESLIDIALVEEVAKPPLPIDTIQSRIDTLKIVQAPVRKLRVIHINEIEPSSTEGFAGKQHRNDLTRPGLHQSTPFLSMSRNTSDNIVKLKISPSN